LSRDVTLENDEPWDVSEELEPTLLNRALVLPVSSARWITVALTLVAATLVRFLGLNRWPLESHEADLALGAWNLVNGNSTSNHLFGAPFTLEWSGLFIFAGGADDAISRIGFASAGVLAVIGCLWLGRWLGTRVGVAAALLVALSPTMVASSRTIDGGALLILLSIAVLGAGLTSLSSRGIGWPVATGVALALLVLTGPLGIPAALLAILGIFLIGRDEGRPGTEALLVGIASALTTVVLITTALLTRPGSLPASIGELFSRLWDEHLANIGSHFYMPAFNLMLNEPLLIVLAIVAVVASPRRELARALGIWTVTAFMLMSLIASDTSAGYAIVALPLALLAAVGAIHLMDRLPWWSFRRGPALLYAISVLLTLAAIFSLIGLVTGGVGDDTVEWLLRFALIVLVGVLPLSLALSALGARLRGDRLLLVLSALLVIVVGLTVRSSVLTASERPGVPGEPLSANALGADIPIVVGRLQRLSRDQTVNVRDSRDPTGGHGLRIAIDEQVAQPFAWYFRDYPNLQTFDPDTQSVPTNAQVIILAGDRDADTMAPGFRGQSYVYGHEESAVYRSPDWAGMISGIIDPDEWRRIVEFTIDRKPDVPPTASEFQVLATSDLAQQLFPATGPFSLDDRPGAGDGDGQFNRPRGIAIAPDGTTYVVDSRNARIEMFDPTGQFVQAFGSAGSALGQLGQFNTAGSGGPNGIAIGDDGNLYVADTWNHRVEVFSADGQYLQAWGQFADLANNPDAQQQTGSFYGPRGIAYHDGLVYVTDTGNERVQVFKPDGTFIRAFGGYGSGDGQLLEPVGIAVTADGTVLVADSHNARIARFSSDGAWLGAWPISQWDGLQFFEPYLALGPEGTVYASTSQQGSVLAIGPTGTVGLELGQSLLRQPYGVAIEPGGAQLLVVDGGLNAVVRVPIPPK
jgi:DNA-binding beta-propeller fold protein YncE